MTAPSLTLRSLQNEETGIDISVPRFQEEEAPLGGVSILYEISVLTKLDLFKTRLHRNEDVVQFSVYKAYREIEDLYNKLDKKYPKAGLPPVPRFSTIDKYTSEEKLAALDRFMQSVAKNIELCHCSIFTHFIGINSQRLPSFTVPSTLSGDINITKPEPQAKDSEDLSDVFPKVKNVAPKIGNNVLQVAPLNVDLFEEVKLVKETQISGENKGTTSGGLFDDFDDDSLFSKNPAAKPTSPPKQTQKVSDVKPKKKEPEKKTEVIENIDDSQIIIKDRKLGEISLFKEQDLGDYVTKEEESLFLVSPKTEDKSKKNMLLFSKESDSNLEDSGLHENLDDLLNLNPLPSVPTVLTETKNLTLEEIKSVHEILDNRNENQVEHLPKKPVPLPRKKSIGKSDFEEQSASSKPEVMPRKVFLAKPEVPSKPVSSTNNQAVTKPTKPPISAKPSLLPKPKPPPKAPKPTVRKDSKDLDLVNANKPQIDIENENSVHNLTDDLNKLDILKYIEQEQKTLESEPSLFD